MIYFELTDKNGKIIAGNINKFSKLLEFKENKNFTLRESSLKGVYSQSEKYNFWFIVENENDLVKSSKLFNLTLKAYKDAALIFFPFYIQKIKEHSHTLVTVQAQMKQKIESLIDGNQLKTLTYNEAQELVKKSLSQNPDDFAEAFLYLNKKSFEIEANIDGFNILYLNNAENLKLRETNIKKAILSVLYPFFKEFKDQDIVVSLHDIDADYAEENKVEINFMLFDLALYNIFSNMTKYVKPGTTVNINFKKSRESFEISFLMVSFRIDREESNSIFDEGYCGKHAKNSGDGIGMAVTKAALKMMNMDILVEPNYSKSFVDEDGNYTENTFKILSLD